jgi:hypothetical protein
MLVAVPGEQAWMPNTLVGWANTQEHREERQVADPKSKALPTAEEGVELESAWGQAVAYPRALQIILSYDLAPCWPAQVVVCTSTCWSKNNRCLELASRGRTEDESSR